MSPGCRPGLMLSPTPGVFRTGLKALFRVKFPEEKVMMRKGLSVSVTVAAILLAVTTVQQAHAQGRRGGGGMGMMQGFSPLAIVGNPAVQKELGLKEDQAAKVKDISQDYQEDLQQQREGAGLTGPPSGDASAEEREKREAQMATIQKNVKDKFMPKLNEVLDKTQQTRLHEIALQVAGPQAFQDADVAKALDLTKEQQDKIKKLGEDMRHKMREAFASGDRSAMRAKMTEMREELTAKSTEVLTKEQQAKFTEMKGKVFDTKLLAERRRRPRTEDSK